MLKWRCAKTHQPEEAYTMNSIADIFNGSKNAFDKIGMFFDKYIGCSLLAKCGIRKMTDVPTTDTEYTYHDNPILRLIGKPESSRVLQKVVKAKDLLIDKLLLCFHMGTAYRMFKEDTFYSGYKKDTFYRFDKMPSANWERLQLETAKNVILDIHSRTKDDHVNALIFDDSLYARTRGKGTDLCAKVFDHNDHKTRLGYRMLTGAWTNTESTVPFAQVLLSTRDPKNMVGIDKDVDKRTLCGKRRVLAKTKGTEVMQDMVVKAKREGIPFDYVMFDTWFSNPAQLISLKKIEADVIAMIKKNGTKYTWTNPATGDTRKLDVKEIYSRNKKRRGLSRYLLSVEVTVNGSNGESIPARLVYARNRNNRKDWVCFVSTNLGLKEEDVIRIYSSRWNIETYFKISKSYLKLRTECHSTSYDALTAHMVIVAIRYMVLVVDRFVNTDNRTIEEFFYDIQRAVVNEAMNCSIVLLLDVMLESVRDCFGASEEQISVLVKTFIDKLPEHWKKQFNYELAS